MCPYGRYKKGQWEEREERASGGQRGSVHFLLVCFREPTLESVCHLFGGRGGGGFSVVVAICTHHSRRCAFGPVVFEMCMGVCGCGLHPVRIEDTDKGK